MRRIGIFALGFAFVSAATPAEAFGLRTHLYIAEQVLSGIQSDCLIAFDDQVARVPQDVCEAVRTEPRYFMAGALGPDVFPDLVIGQNYAHPGTPGGRQAADWLEHLLIEAKDRGELAFAYGQMIHAAGDVFAHSYVNNYAGDVFDISKRWHKDVEQRHFDLEKYIDQRLPYKPRVEQLEVPSDLLLRAMVQTSYLPANIEVTHKFVSKLISNPGAQVAGILAEKLTKAGPAAHMSAMWAILLVAERAPVVAKCNEIEAVNRMTVAFRDYASAEKAARSGAELPTLEPYAPRKPATNCPQTALEEANVEFELVVMAARGIGWNDKGKRGVKAADYAACAVC